MNINFDIITLVFLIFYVSSQLLKNLVVKDYKHTAAQFILLGHMLMLSLSVSEVFFIVDRITAYEFLNISKVTLVGIFAIIFTQTILLKVYPYTKQKIKVLWRIPIIGMLVGYYFEFQYLSFICIGYWLAAMIALCVKYRDYRVLIPRLAIIVLPAFALFYVKIESLWLLNIVVLFLLLGSRSLNNISIINMKFKMKGKSVE